MSNYNVHGSVVKISREDDVKILKDLPPSVYLVCVDPFGAFYLTKHEEFSLPTKFYGDIKSKAERVLNTFEKRTKSTGVILSGEKGSGKTLLAKYISAELIKKGISTILVNQAYYGDAFTSFLDLIDVPVMVMFDEFEKNYSRDAQNSLLTLFDGVSNTKKLYILTCNDEHELNSFIKNRPGRFYYNFSYDGLDQAFIEEYTHEKLINKDNVESLLNSCHILNPVNFDMLQAIIEEMNRYDEKFVDVLKYLNIKPTRMTDSAYKLEFVSFADPIDNKFIPDLLKLEFYFNPLKTWSIYRTNGEDELDIDFSPNEVQEYNKDRVIYSTDEYKFIFTRVEVKKFNYFDLI